MHDNARSEFRNVTFSKLVFLGNKMENKKELKPINIETNG